MADQQKSVEKCVADSSSGPRQPDDTRYDPAPVEQKWAAQWDEEPLRYAPEPPSSGKPK